MDQRRNSHRKVPADPASPGQGGWDEEEDERSAAFVPLTREQAQALRARDPSLSPWRVIGAQIGVGTVMALAAVLLTGSQVFAWSLLYGAATVVVPGALLARGMTSRLTSMAPMVSAVSVMLWEMVKIAATVAMLIAAPKLVSPLSWPALLVGLVSGMSVYWFALLWRGRNRSNVASERDGSPSASAHRR